MKEIIISQNEAHQRFDKFLAKYLNQASKSFIYKMLRKKNITLNGAKGTGNERLVPNDKVTFFFSDETLAKFTDKNSPRTDQKDKFKLNIVYEDQHIILINKPAGILSQKAAVDDISINEYLLDYLKASHQLSDDDLRAFKPACCNRLDRNTTGLLAAGKTMLGLQTLSKMFRDRTVKKYYICLVKGDVKQASHVTGYVHKNQKTNKVTLYKNYVQGTDKIETIYRPIYSNSNVTLLEVQLITGKTHQIRAHLANLGYPIIGDMKYGNDRTNRWFKETHHIKYQLLHSQRLTFPYLDNGLSNLSEKTFIAPLPHSFNTILRDLDFPVDTVNNF